MMLDGARVWLVCCLVAVAGGVSSCRSNEPASTSPPVSSNSAPITVPQPNLIGMYTISEVERNGKAIKVPPMSATMITFMPDGSYTRFSKSNGVMDHTDEGSYRIEGDQLVLTAIFANSKTVKRPTEKRHPFALEENGRVLRLRGSDGKVAIFRKNDIQQPPS